jgi:endonuclease/exonuclease/phosphatase family metal-dependent hydrolase
VCVLVCVAALQLPGGVVVDVYTTHLPLSEAARNRTTIEIWDFIQTSRQGDIQILTGDMNGESNEPAIQFLQVCAHACVFVHVFVRKHVHTRCLQCVVRGRLCLFIMRASG